MPLSYSVYRSKKNSVGGHLWSCCFLSQQPVSIFIFQIEVLQGLSQVKNSSVKLSPLSFSCQFPIIWRFQGILCFVIYAPVILKKYILPKSFFFCYEPFHWLLTSSFPKSLHFGLLQATIYLKFDLNTWQLHYSVTFLDLIVRLPFKIINLIYFSTQSTAFKSQYPAVKPKFVDASWNFWIFHILPK